MIAVLVIEGPDFSGKSTIAKLVAARLEEEGFAVRSQQSCLCERSFGRLVRWTQERLESDSGFKTAVFHLAYLVDLAVVELRRLAGRSVAGGAVVVQESYIDRVIAHGRFRGGRRRWLARALERIEPRLTRDFTKIYLRVPFAERRRRFLASGGRDRRDRARFGADADRHQRIAAELEQRIGERGYFVIPAETLTAAETASAIVRQVLARPDLAQEAAR